MEKDIYEVKRQFDINMRERRYVWSMNKFHYHDSYEIYYLAEGTRKFLVQNWLYDVFEGDVILLRPNEFHRSMDSGPHTRVNIEFTNEFLRGYFTPSALHPLMSCFDTGFIRLPEKESARLAGTLQCLWEEYHEERGDYFVTFADVLKQLCRAAESQKSSAAPAQTLSKASQRLQPVISYINEHYDTVFSLDEIADACYLNKSYLCRLFKKEMEITVMEYVNHVRVQQACELLAAGGGSLTDVSAQCGFSTPSCFSCQFKQIMGRTPSQFRAELKLAVKDTL